MLNKFLFDIQVIEPPIIDDFTNGGFLEMVQKIIVFIFQFFSNAYFALIEFYDMLIEINVYIKQLTLSSSSGNIEGLPLLEIIGAYRYLVTDPIFYLTYILIASGCMFTLYKLFLLIKASIVEFKATIITKGSTTSGYMNILKQLFGIK